MDTVLQLRIENHGNELVKFFDLPENTDPVKFCKSLFRLENKGHRLCEMYCNGDISPYEFDIEIEKIQKSLKKIIPLDKVFFNFDPRGYFLKIKEEESRDFYYRDWGGYGIIAPDLRD